MAPVGDDLPWLRSVVQRVDEVMKDSYLVEARAAPIPEVRERMVDDWVQVRSEEIKKALDAEFSAEDDVATLEVEDEDVALEAP